MSIFFWKGETAEEIDINLDEKENIVFLTSEIESGAEMAVNSLTSAKNADEALLFIRNPERANKMVRSWYGNTARNPMPKLGSVEERNFIEDDERYFVLLQFSQTDSFEPAMFSVEYRSPDKFLVDWEVSIHQQAEAIADFQEFEEAPWTFRFLVENSDYYSKQFPEKDWLSFRLTFQREEYTLYGYLNRTRHPTTNG
ncbi:MAG: hypothetical protein R3F11_12865 [Verrucomicrobiales bacterium]